MNPLITPRLCGNGNTAKSLIDPLKDVLAAIRALELAMANASDVVHGRNFQTVDDPIGTRMAANAAWRERQVMIHHLADDITNLAIGIQGQS